MAQDPELDEDAQEELDPDEGFIDEDDDLDDEDLVDEDEDDDFEDEDDDEGEDDLDDCDEDEGEELSARDDPIEEVV
jgi:hypothetical protein